MPTRPPNIEPKGKEIMNVRDQTDWRQRESDAHTEEYLAGGRSLIEKLRRQPGPGQRPDEIARLAQAHKVAQERAVEEKRVRTDRAAQTRQVALDQATRLRDFRTRMDTDLGQTKFNLRQAVERSDYDAALDAAGRLQALQVISEEVRQAGQRFGALNRGSMFWAVGAGRV